MSVRERWKAVPGFPYYEVSTIGRVRVKDRPRLTQWGNYAIRKGQLIHIARGKEVFLWKDGKAICKSVAWLVLTTFKRKGKRGEWALHKNDIAQDNRLENVYWGTPKENTEDAFRNRKRTRNHLRYIYFVGKAMEKQDVRCK